MARSVGRYLLLDKLASGGMGAVHLGRLRGEGGFSKLVAIKLLLSQYASDPEFREMFLDEARIVSRIRHANVVSTLDVIEAEGELFLIMEYVDGLALSSFMRDLFGRGRSIPVPVAVAIASDALEGLHAAHEARSDAGELQRIIHRDVSPQNIMLARDGASRIVDFGVAHAADRGHLTRPGEVKGKAAYMAPEQALGRPVEAAADLYAASIVLWEMLTGQRLFAGETSAETILRQLQQIPPAPGSLRSEVPPALDAIVLRGLAKNASERFATAAEMARALEGAVPRASRADVAAFVGIEAAAFFEERARLLGQLDETERTTSPDPSAPSNDRMREATTLREQGAPMPATRGADLASRRSSQSRAAWAWIGLPLALASAVVLHLKPWTPTAPSTPDAIAPRPAVLETATALAPRPSVVDARTENRVEGVDPKPPALERPTSDPARRASRTAPAETRPKALSASPSASVTPLPPCCAGTIHLRFSDCLDNCEK